MTIRSDLELALTEVSASSAGGAPFLIAYGITFFITALLYFLIPIHIAALAVMFQGGIALPLAFLLERQMGSQRMSQENPLRALSAQLAMSQGLGIPALIIAYTLNPAAVPVVIAALGGMHFLPYAWLHRTRLYIVLGIAISIGAFVLQVIFGSTAFPYILFYISAVYWIAAPLVYRHAANIVKERTSTSTAVQQG